MRCSRISAVTDFGSRSRQHQRRMFNSHAAEGPARPSSHSAAPRMREPQIRGDRSGERQPGSGGSAVQSSRKSARRPSSVSRQARVRIIDLSHLGGGRPDRGRRSADGIERSSRIRSQVGRREVRVRAVLTRSERIRDAVGRAHAAKTTPRGHSNTCADSGSAQLPDTSVVSSWRERPWSTGCPPVVIEWPLRLS